MGKKELKATACEDLSVTLYLGPNGEIRKVDGDLLEQLGWSRELLSGACLDSLHHPGIGTPLGPGYFAQFPNTGSQWRVLCLNSTLFGPQWVQARFDWLPADECRGDIAFSAEIQTLGHFQREWERLQRKVHRLEDENRRLRQHLQPQEVDAQRLHERFQNTGIPAFASGVAHHINNRLTGIKGFGQLLAESSQLDDDQRKQVAAILKESHGIEGLVRNLMRFGDRCDRGGFEPEPIRTILTQLVSVFEVDLNQAQVALAWSGAEDTCFPCNPYTLHWIFGELIRNSIEAYQNLVSSEGRLIKISWKLEASGRLRIDYQDDAGGVSPEESRRLMEPFYTTRLERKAQGMGLALVESLIWQTGGEISMENRRDTCGIAVAMRFPVRKPVSPT